MGTLINAAAILAGGLIGLFFGKKIPERLRNTIVSGLGLFTLAYGVYIFANTRNILIPLSSLVIGTIIGEVLHIEEGLDGLGERLRRRFASSEQAQGKTQPFCRWIRDHITPFLYWTNGHFGFDTGWVERKFSNACNQIHSGCVGCFGLCFQFGDWSSVFFGFGFGLSGSNYPCCPIGWPWF